VNLKLKKLRNKQILCGKRLITSYLISDDSPLKINQQIKPTKPIQSIQPTKPTQQMNLKRSDPLTSNNKPLASLCLDLDNKWSYMKTHGDAGWEKFPSYLDIFIPLILDILDEWELTITFFIVGQDAALDRNKHLLKLLTERGHEVGNHSFNHEPWLHSYSKEQLKGEIIEAENHILRVTGQKPIGFRGPGFSYSPDILKILAENNYLYDASTFPTYLAPLARIYYFWTSNLTNEEKRQRRGLFGSFREGMRSVKPYYWQWNSGVKLLEIPVTTIPLIKIPFHLSYLIYLSRYSHTLMSCYLKTAILFCKITGTEPCLLLHPLDLLDAATVPELAFFPGMDLSRNQKIQLFNQVIKTLSKHFKLVKMSTHARSILKKNNLKIYSPH